MEPEIALAIPGPDERRIIDGPPPERPTGQEVFDPKAGGASRRQGGTGSRKNPAAGRGPKDELPEFPDDYTF